MLWQIAVVLMWPCSIRCFALSPKSTGVSRSVCGFVTKLARASGLRGVSVDMFCSLTTSESRCRVEITGVCGFWPLPLSVGQGKVALSVHHRPWVWEPPFCRRSKSGIRIIRGGFNGCAAERPATRNSVNEHL